MKFSFVTLYVADLDRSLFFYNGLLGLELCRRQLIEDGELAFLGDANQPQIELIARPDHVGSKYTGFSIGIDVDSLDEAARHLSDNGFPVVRGPIAPNPHTRFSYVLDPDGVEIQLTEYC